MVVMSAEAKPDPKKVGGAQKKVAFAHKIQETGATWDEALPSYQGGKININFYKNIIGYTAGGFVNGTVDIVIEEKFEATNLELQFVGEERVYMETEVRAVKEWNRETKEILKMSIIMAEYDKHN